MSITKEGPSSVSSYMAGFPEGMDGILAWNKAKVAGIDSFLEGRGYRTYEWSKFYQQNGDTALQQLAEFFGASSFEGWLTTISTPTQPKLGFADSSAVPQINTYPRSIFAPEKPRHLAAEKPYIEPPRLEIQVPEGLQATEWFTGRLRFAHPNFFAEVNILRFLTKSNYLGMSTRDKYYSVATGMISQSTIDSTGSEADQNQFAFKLISDALSNRHGWIIQRDGDGAFADFRVCFDAEVIANLIDMEGMSAPSLDYIIQVAKHWVFVKNGEVAFKVFEEEEKLRESKK